MIGVLLMTHGQLGESLIDCANHVFGETVSQLAQFSISHQRDQVADLSQARKLITTLDSGSGVIILSDIYGATPCNMVTKLLDKQDVAGVAGVNLPMLLAVLNNRQDSLTICVEKAVESGREGVVHFTRNHCEYADENK